MTKEQEEAIERLNSFIKVNKDFFENQGNMLINKKDIQDIDTVLSMLKEQQEENKKKDKIIDLIADFIFQNIDVEEDICNSAYIKCKQETGQDITCINCIKQYFERKAEKE